MLTAGRLRELMNYDQETGALIWKPRSETDRMGRIWNAKCASKCAGSPGSGGYLRVRVDGELFLAHRLVWLYVHGRWPTGGLDHANCDPQDNRIANLREATPSQNGANRRQFKTSTLGKGIARNRNGRLFARIIVDGRSVYLGVFDTLKEANAAYAAAALKYFGEFARAA